MVKKILSIALCAVVLLFIYAPILLLVVYSFDNSTVINLNNFNFSFGLYRDLFRDEKIMEILFNTIWLALVAAARSPAPGTGGGW